MSTSEKPYSGNRNPTKKEAGQAASPETAGRRTSGVPGEIRRYCTHEPRTGQQKKGVATEKSYSENSLKPLMRGAVVPRSQLDCATQADPCKHLRLIVHVCVRTHTRAYRHAHTLGGSMRKSITTVKDKVRP